jgi:protease I
MPSTPSPSLESSPLVGQSVLILTGDIYEDLELWYPKLRLIEAGAKVVVAGEATGKTYAGKNGYPCVADAEISKMEHEDFDALVVPGGFMPDKLRRDPVVLQLVRDFFYAGKPVAAICHGGWIPISAGIYQGIRVTGSPGIKDDLINAGAVFENAPVVVDRNSVSSRKPDDLPDFCRELIKLMADRKR